MKNKYRYIVIALVTVLSTSMISCSDFLDEDAKGSLTPDTFFKNEEEATLALNTLNDEVNDSGFNNHLGTDVGVSGRGTLAAAHRIGAYEYDADTNQIVNGWATAYSAIKNANFFLASIQNSDLSDQIKGRVIAQILFFRAYFYLNLAIQYGDVPYWRDELTDIASVSLLGKTDASVIITDMIADLDEAISSGYLSEGKWNENDGRPTIWSAKMLKAYCYVWLAKDDASQWNNALPVLKDVTSNSPHQLNPDYADMYRGGNEYNDEIIFGKQYLADVYNNNVNSTAHYNNPAETGPTRSVMGDLGIAQGSAPFTIRKSFADTWPDNDIRKKYNVWDHEILEDGSEVNFNWIYIPKLVRGPVPTSDPLLAEAEVNNISNSPKRIMTIAEAYLLLAEAEFMNGGSTDEALDAINKIRERTSLPLYTSINLEDIQNERGWELCAEGFWGRKRDLIRWGILESTVIGLPEAEAAAGASATALIRAQDEADIISAAPTGKYYVYPIPLNEILQSKDIGGALTQNPLWE
ncbi:RagB/SusD family nutrient uptake outer membrane protein [Formosa haliotis]|uniref:RagB/SusD family nutrient uptake outer membrane protein n=1 Tax=Formosa haliotis TaxID=1555194 RepID=UPI0008252847|nr:RagB/SusD family nutrient uptake outer membrane protein [Formosa haliotis]